MEQDGTLSCCSAVVADDRGAAGYEANAKVLTTLDQVSQATASGDQLKVAEASQFLKYD